MMNKEAKKKTEKNINSRIKSKVSGFIEIEHKKVRRLPQHKKPQNYQTDKKQVFIIGSKGIPAAYGGFETFVEMLTKKQRDPGIRYHVARMAEDDRRFLYNEAKCFNVKSPDIGPARAIYYDLAALHRCINYCEARPSIEKPIFYVLACRIGPFIHYYKRKIHKLGGQLYVNPDGHEWLRSKWSAPVRKYWKISERLMVKHADLLICDSKNIEKYIQESYAKYHPQTTFIAYGADIQKPTMDDTDPKLVEWYQEHDLSKKKYYLIVGRFVPENNFETMIREFMAFDSKKDLVIITTANSAFTKELQDKLGFDRDSRIKFVGTVYDQELLTKIRENAYGYLHGHEVGGTNPSLLEALGATDLNLLLGVGFNREVGEDAALYWNKENGSLKDLLDQADHMTPEDYQRYGELAKKRIAEAYSWEYIIDQYESTFNQ